MEIEGPGREVLYEAPFAELLDIRPGLSSDGLGSAGMIIREHHLNSGGVVQGGIIVTLADYAFHRAVISRLGPGQEGVTVELKVNFIAPAKDGELTATARVLSSGRRIFVVEGEVTDDRQNLIAHGLGTTLVVQPNP